MSDDHKRNDRPKTAIRVAISISPMSAADDRVIGMVGSFVFDLANITGCSRRTSSKMNVLSIEEMTSAFEANLMSAGAMRFELLVDDEHVLARCVFEGDEARHEGTDAWFPLDEPGPTNVNPATKTMTRKRAELLGPKAKLAETVQERRVDRPQGGLGLMHLGSTTRRKLGDPDGGGEGGSPAPANAVIPLPKKPQ